MDTQTTGQAARMLNTTIPRVRRALAGSGLPVVKSEGGRTLIPSSTYQQLARQLGAVPEVPGLNREEALVLAVMNHRPLGLTSARAAAEAAGISPTSASRALTRLRDLGYVTQDVEKLVEGKVVARPIWHLRRSGAPWQQVAPFIRQVVPPETKAQPGKLPQRVPGRLAHLFWNADLSKVQLPRDARYVAGRILTSNDTQGLAWMARSLPHKAILEASQARGMDEQVRALGRNLARPL
jgi:DNA-binding transcriptional ArsR family regulator